MVFVYCHISQSFFLAVGFFFYCCPCPHFQSLFCSGLFFYCYLFEGKTPSHIPLQKSGKLSDVICSPGFLIIQIGYPEIQMKHEQTTNTEIFTRINTDVPFALKLAAYVYE